MFSYTCYLNEENNTVSLTQENTKSHGMCLTLDVVQNKVVFVNTNNLIDMHMLYVVISELMSLSGTVKDLMKNFLFNFSVRRTTKEENPNSSNE